MSNRKPALQLVREGNAGHHPQSRLEGGVRLPAAAPGEPRWTKVWPAKRGDAQQQRYVKRLRAWASEEWERVVRQLDSQGLLAELDAGILLTHCEAFALEQECIRNLAINGMLMLGERGWQKNGSSTILSQQRDTLKHTRSQLGLSPVARDGMQGRVDFGDEASPFD